VSDLQAEENVLERDRFSKLWETHVPLYLDANTTGRADAVAEIYADYAGIQNEVDRLFRTLLATLGAGLLALYLVLLPIIRRASRTLSAQNAQLEGQAERLQELLEGEQRTVSDLRELNRLKDEFVAMASHEVRTPLTSIIGYAKTLRRPEFAHDAEARNEFLDAIERQGTRLSRLVENLLAASRIEDVRGRPATAPVSISDVLAETVGALGSRSHRVLVSHPADLPLLKTDERILGLILANLLDNALKFSPEDEPCEVGARRTPESVHVWVTDHGIGIDPGDLDRIFGRFYQVDSSVTRRFGGVGLGLHLVRELVHSLGGTVTVTSRPGWGSTFVVTLPVAPPGEQSDVEDAGPLVQTASR
jgi:two-component system, OmpR family, phosphate regulon sensor histidine kinase PhoR